MSITAFGPSRSGAGSRVAADAAHDIVGLRYFTTALDRANLRIILPGALIGIAVGTLCFGLLDEGWLLLNAALFVTGLKLVYDGVTRLAAL